MPASSFVSIALFNPKSPSNVGAVLRAAGCFSANQVRYSGQRFAQAARYHTDTKNIANQIPLVERQDLLADLPTGTRIICVELAEGATPLPHFSHPQNAVYVFGPEDGSLPQHLIDQADEVIYMPTKGCLNLAASVNITLYDRTAKLSPLPVDDTLIKSSRDTNNRLVFDVTKKSG